VSTVQVECSHDLCQCMVTAEIAVLDPTEAYCSPDCRSAETGEEDGEDVCACGHPECDTP
jgi:hypothetical protein